jgi:hypothetical protein
MPKKPSLILVSPSPTSPNPPLRQLAKDGRALWDAITSEFDISDAGGRELLQEAAEALDRVQSLRVAIERDGEIIQTRTGPKEHPLLRAELAGRAFITRTLQRLGVNLEPVRPAAGRPPAAY